MKYTEHVELTVEHGVLTSKKRLGKNQKARLTQLVDQLSHMTQPPPTPRRAPTGNRADFQGNTYSMHSGSRPTLREMRRAKMSGEIQHMRSRIQRLTRRRRTGGVR